MSNLSPDAPAPVIDVHAHILLPALQQLVAEADPQGFGAQQALEVRRNGPESMAASGKMIKERWPQLTDLDRRLADMDAQGVDVQLVSPSPSHFYYFAGEELSLQLARAANHAVREFVERAPERLNGLGLVPLQHPHLMVEALEHAVLECGLLGVEIGSFAATPGGDRSTVELGDPRLEPLWSRAAELGALVFLHPFGCSLDERLDRFYLANTVSQPAENAVALSHLVFSGVLDRHPELKVLAAHGGGYLPTTLGRSDHAWRVRPEAHGCAEPPSSYLQKLYFDSLVHSPAELAALVAAAGPGQVLLGSDYPFDMGSDQPVAEVNQAQLPSAAEAKVLAGNAAALGITPASTRTVSHPA
ncbi:amidohydrolase 2 [Pseudarthrobacter chlorophenolicus A6]|uniref:Amidohydrolase 2 n=1 Tax=Pseudarthrobacter chlorophenolicus (strain ATCC 700700 / DSM 12829 / CIP 107037 / JCM 12360 / KCTC 9906 / NCIMB 13794 / A6) TaxID=452863 RepID=B8H6H8_PSECP|nr:amidohydrolase family protein [Pseudarthrobacter chlorophenolicus]ACL41504.1 amidohydrolase 2 [Pseudarthrobacter chlorophenolicus A6]SDQ63017.1 aminocarboxymuconate-semialdehyde decarboxylase [Pseudarthrobacter chlorophenolicus]